MANKDGTEDKKGIVAYEADLEDFGYDPDNPNVGSIRGGAMLEYSIREYGGGRSLLADVDNILVAGNKTRKQAENAGLRKVIVVESDGDALIVHKRRDLKLTGEQATPKARELSYMDNRTNEVGLTWDADRIVSDLNNGVDLSMVFYDDELTTVTGGVVEDPDDDERAGLEAVPEMELHPFEHYDYVVLLFRNTFDWTRALDLFGIEKEGFKVTKGVRKVGLARCIDGARVLALFDEILTGGQEG